MSEIIPIEPWRQRRENLARSLAAVSILRVEAEQDITEVVPLVPKSEPPEIVA